VSRAQFTRLFQFLVRCMNTGPTSLGFDSSPFRIDTEPKFAWAISISAWSQRSGCPLTQSSLIRERLQPNPRSQLFVQDFFHSNSLASYLNEPFEIPPLHYTLQNVWHTNRRKSCWSKTLGGRWGSTDTLGILWGFRICLKHQGFWHISLWDWDGRQGKQLEPPHRSSRRPA